MYHIRSRLAITFTEKADMRLFLLLTVIAKHARLPAMSRYCLCAIACLLGLTVISCGEQKKKSAEAVAPAELSPVASTLHEMVARVQAIHDIIKGMKTQEDAARLLPELVREQARYKELYLSLTPLEDNDEACRAAVQEIEAAFRALSETASADAFVELIWGNPGLQFHLLVAGDVFPCVVNPQTADYILQCQVMEQDIPAAMRTDIDSIYAEAAQRHADFMAKNSRNYAGGNGSSEAQAIILRPCVEAAEDQNTDELADKLMVDYMRAVYPQFRFGFGRFAFTPDGAYYTSKVQFPGLYTDDKGASQLVKFPVTFCRRLPKQDK